MLRYFLYLSSHDICRQMTAFISFNAELAPDDDQMQRFRYMLALNYMHIMMPIYY